MSISIRSYNSEYISKNDDVDSELMDVKLKTSSTSQTEMREEGHKSITPNQPLPGSTMSDSELWRYINKWLSVVADAMSGVSKEAVANKKQLINEQAKATKDSIMDREKKLKDQMEAQKNASIWDKIGMALGVLAAIIVAPFNPVAAVVMIAVIVAAIVIPKIVDKVLEAAGVNKQIREWVKTGLEIGISLVGTVLSFNPAGIVTSIGKAAAAGAAKVAAIAEKIMSAANNIRALSSITTKVGNAVNKIMKLIKPLLDKIKSIAEGGAKVTSRIQQITSVASDISSVTSAAYGIKSSVSEKDRKIQDAKMEQLETIIQQIISFLNQIFKGGEASMELLGKNNQDSREYFDYATSISV